MGIADIRHPYYNGSIDQWNKWRNIYCGGDDFIQNHLVKYSLRESNENFKSRKRISPSPSFAKAAINDIKNSIFQRLTDVTRKGGSSRYHSAISGELGGIDLDGCTMNSFLGNYVLPELLSMGKVAIYIDAPSSTGLTLRDTQNNHPYLYTYRVEEIYSWTYENNKLTSVLLTDYIDTCCEHTGLPTGQTKRHRYIYLTEDGKVAIQFYNNESQRVDINNQISTEPTILDINEIPLVILELSDSLLKDVANHQISLLNLESSDISFLLQSNFAFYVEHADNRQHSPHIQPDGSVETVEQSQNEIRVGPIQGRQYSREKPGFIHPSAEPLQASMEKQRQLKEDIRALINLALSNIKPKMASAASKAFDERGLESGLSSIGLELEYAEKKIASIWAQYEKTDDVATISYPKKYALQSDADRREDAKQLSELKDEVPSETYQKEMSKRIVLKLLSHDISSDELEQIFKEIDNGLAFSSKSEVIFQAVERGLLDLDTAAKLMGYPKETVKKAAEDHAARLARIQEAQTKETDQTSQAGARGLNDLSDNPRGDARNEKTNSRETTNDEIVSDKTRGKGKE